MRGNYTECLVQVSIPQILLFFFLSLTSLRDFSYKRIHKLFKIFIVRLLYTSSQKYNYNMQTLPALIFDDSMPSEFSQHRNYW